MFLIEIPVGIFQVQNVGLLVYRLMRSPSSITLRILSRQSCQSTQKHSCNWMWVYSTSFFFGANYAFAKYWNIFLSAQMSQVYRNKYSSKFMYVWICWAWCAIDVCQWQLQEFRALFRSVNTKNFTGIWIIHFVTDKMSAFYGIVFWHIRIIIARAHTWSSHWNAWVHTNPSVTGIIFTRDAGRNEHISGLLFVCSCTDITLVRRWETNPLLKYLQLLDIPLIIRKWNTLVFNHDKNAHTKSIFNFSTLVTVCTHTRTVAQLLVVFPQMFIHFLTDTFTHSHTHTHQQF